MIGKQVKKTTKQLIIEQLKKIPIVQIVCEKVGIGRATYYRWRKESNNFSTQTDEAIIAGRLLINDMAESQLIKAIKDENFSAITFWLKNHHKAYTNKIDMKAEINAQITGKDGKPLIGGSPSDLYSAKKKKELGIE